MFRSKESERLFYVSESVRQMYEPEEGKPVQGEPLMVLGERTPAEFAQIVAKEDAVSARKVLVFGVTPAFEEGLKVARKANPLMKAALFPENSQTAPGFIDLVPKPFYGVIDVAILAQAAERRVRR